MDHVRVFQKWISWSSPIPVCITLACVCTRRPTASRSAVANLLAMPRHGHLGARVSHLPRAPFVVYTPTMTPLATMRAASSAPRVAGSITEAHDVLVVGDGDFSYSVALATVLVSGGVCTVAYG